VAQAVEEARKQRELSKEALAADLDRLEARVRAELDVRSRLRRDGPRLLALGAAAALLVGAILVLRTRLRRNDAGDDDPPASLDDVAAELREIKREIERQRKASSGSLVTKLLLRGVSAAGAAGGTFVARRMLSRPGASSGAAHEGSGGG
jgi:hypothetical protein